VVFPDGVWRADVEARYPSGSGARTAAEVARREFERDGVPDSELLACEPEGPEGTRLEACLKIYLPVRAGDPRQRPFGMVFIDVGKHDPALLMLAFGVRHPPEASRQPSVYQIADRRLHPPPAP
jgi:hypothetical protein